MALGFFFNNKNCYGCKTCAMACITTNLPGNTQTFMRQVNEYDPDFLCGGFISMACNHCDEPACMAICPQGAYTKLEDGTVKQDHAKCIGCQSCVNACPYGAPKYDEASKTVYKCDLCYDRRERGLAPACVEACPGANLMYGEIEVLKAQHPEAVSDIDGVLPDSSQTHPNLLVLLAEKK